jgi:flagellar motor switch protein FliN/FliY
MADQARNLEQAVDQAVETVAEQLGQLSEGLVTGDPIGLENLLDVPVNITVLIGTTRMSLGDLVALGPGSLIPLDREAHEPADILVNGRVIARGEVVTIDNTYGVRISHLEKDV